MLFSYKRALKLEKRRGNRKKRIAHCRRNGESIIKTSYLRRSSKEKAKLVKSSDKILKGSFLIKKNDINYNVGGVAALSFPNELDFNSATIDTGNFFKALLENAFKLNIERLPSILYLNFSKLKRIYPESALILIALFSKLSIYSPNTQIRVKQDLKEMSSRAYSVLKQIGFWDYFKGNDFNAPKGEGSDKKIIRHKHHRCIDVRYIKDILEEFNIDSIFGVSRRRYITRAILEAMNNVLDHAYLDVFTKTSVRNKKFLYDHWWMCCYKNKNEKGFTFAIYDDGVGMPITLKKKGLESIFSTFSLLKDTDIIVRAFENGDRTRTEELARGNGLPTIIEPVNEFDSILTVLTNSNYCVFEKNKDPKTNILPNELSQLGTLISWRINA